MDDDVQAMENNKKNTDYPKLDKNLRMCSRLKPGSLFPSPSPFRVESLRTRLGAELQTRVRASFLLPGHYGFQEQQGTKGSVVSWA